MTDINGINHTATIVSAYLGNHSVAAAQIPSIIAAMHAAFGQLGSPTVPTLAEPRKPAVPVRKSVQSDAIICLECGFRGLMLKRHLITAHGFSVNEYRARWGLASDYPVVAPAYSSKRSSLAKSFGLGSHRSPT